jgi:hypothetical protein
MIKGRLPFLSDAGELAPVDVHDPLGELPVPTLDERVLFYLRAVHGNRDFTQEERSNARNVLLNSMAAEIAAQAEQSPKGELPGRETTHAADRRKGAIRVAPIAGRRTSILALTATLGLVVIVTGGTLGYRWTYPHTGEEVTEPAKQDRLPLLLARSRLGPTPRSNMWCRSRHNAAREMYSRFFAGCKKSSQHCLVRRLSAELILAGRVTAHE